MCDLGDYYIVFNDLTFSDIKFDDELSTEIFDFEYKLVTVCRIVLTDTLGCAGNSNHRTLKGWRATSTGYKCKC